MTDGERLLATSGRGLGIVAMYSTTWGAEVSSTGKVVWFEPAAEVRSRSTRPGAGDVFDLARSGSRSGWPIVGEPGSRITVRLLGMPVQVFAHYRNWYEELRRELRLLALNHGARLPARQRALRAHPPGRAGAPAGRGVDRARRRDRRRAGAGRPRVPGPGRARPPRWDGCRGSSSRSTSSAASSGCSPWPGPAAAGAAGVVPRRVRAPGGGRGADPVAGSYAVEERPVSTLRPAARPVIGAVAVGGALGACPATASR